MLREIRTPTKREIGITIPEEYVNHEVEILVLPLFEMDSPSANETNEPDEALARLFKNAPNVKIEAPL